MTVPGGHLIDEALFRAELEAVAAEAIGWIPLEDRAYLHVAPKDEDQAPRITIVGSPLDADPMGNCLLLL